jgi:hypothetical protein
MKDKIKAFKLKELDDDWHKVDYGPNYVKKVARKRINAKSPTPPKRTGGKVVGKRLNYKFPDDGG